jgi:YgiT-type zinc finger domain-containing protein
MTTDWQETLVETTVTYLLNHNGKLILIENVPARVNEETGEQFFSPSTVEHLQQTILDSSKPDPESSGSCIPLLRRCSTFP